MYVLNKFYDLDILIIFRVIERNGGWQRGFWAERGEGRKARYNNF